MTSGGVVAGARLVSAGKEIEFPSQDLDKIKELRARYPDRASAVMPVLWLAQKRFGFLSSEAISRVAEALDLPVPEVAQVATFYSMYNLEPVGKYLVQVCATLSCSLMGADALVEHLKKRLGLEIGQTSADGRFTLKTVECLASCGTGPMLQINEKSYNENLDLESLDRLIDSLP